MTTDVLTTRPVTRRSVRTTATAFLVVGSALAVNGAALGGQLFFDSRDYSQVADSPVHLVHYVVWTACLVALSQLYPRLAEWRGPDGTSIGRGLLTLAAVGAGLDACSRFVSAFVNPFLATVDPRLLDTAPDMILLLPLLATGVVAMAGAVAVAVVGWRRRLLSPHLAILLTVGAVAIPAIGPLANVLFGLALVWVGSRLRRAA